jgi:hypothetical protein
MKLGVSSELLVDRLSENLQFLDAYFLSRGMKWTFVIKAFENYPDSFIRSLSQIRCASVASPRHEHLRIFRNINKQVETWWLNYAGIHFEYDWIDVELTHTTNGINGKTCLMLLIDSSRKGFEPDQALALIQDKTCLRIGAYLDCSRQPEMSFFQTWKHYKFDYQLIQSLGTSVSFSLTDQLMDIGINHFRIGETAITGRDILTKKPINGLRQDVIIPQKNCSYHFITNPFAV